MKNTNKKRIKLLLALAIVSICFFSLKVYASLSLNTVPADGATNVSTNQGFVIKSSDPNEKLFAGDGSMKVRDSLGVYSFPCKKDQYFKGLGTNQVTLLFAFAANDTTKISFTNDCFENASGEDFQGLKLSFATDASEVNAASCDALSSNVDSPTATLSAYSAKVKVVSIDDEHPFLYKADSNLSLFTVFDGSAEPTPKPQLFNTLTSTKTDLAINGFGSTQLTIKPLDDSTILAFNSSYSLDIEATRLNCFTENLLLSFSTASANAPNLIGQYPRNNTKNISDIAYIEMTFSENIYAGSGSIKIYEVDEAGNIISLITTIASNDAKLHLNGNKFRIYPTTGIFEENKYYSIVVDRGFINAGDTTKPNAEINLGEWAFHTIHKKQFFWEDLLSNWI